MLAHSSSKKLISPPTKHFDRQVSHYLSITALDHLQLNEQTPIGQLPTYDYAVPRHTVVRQVERVLRSNSALPGVTVLDGSEVLGIISRRKFFELLGQLYGVAVHLGRAVGLMVEAAGLEPVILSADTLIPEAVQVALSRPSEGVYEPVLVEDESAGYHILDIYTLLLAQSRLFRNLQSDLQDINQELEQRVIRRTAELQRVNQSLKGEITIRERAEQQLQWRLRYEQAITQCANILLSSQDSEEVIVQALEFLREAADVSRVYIGRNVTLQSLGACLQLTHQVCAPEILPVPTHQQIFTHDSWSDWIPALWQGQPVIGYIGEATTAGRAILMSLGIQSVLLLPIGEPDKWYGVIGFDEQDTERNWRHDDIQLLQTVAWMLHTYIERQRDRIALSEARDEALRASQFKSELLAKVSHELRTPLGSILGYTQLLQKGSFGSVTAKQKDIAGLVIKSTKYLNMLVNSLLDQAQLESKQFILEKERFSLRQLVDEVQTRIQVLADEKSLQFIIHVDEQMPDSIFADRLRIQQIVINLLSNAVKFTEAGQVRLRIYPIPISQEWMIELSDTGPGISEEDQVHIFEPFRQVDGSPTREHSGTGLGLSITKQLVDMMGGEINLDSILGLGSLFTVRLPLVLGTPEQVVEKPAAFPVTA